MPKPNRSALHYIGGQKITEVQKISARSSETLKAALRRGRLCTDWFPDGRWRLPAGPLNMYP